MHADRQTGSRDFFGQLARFAVSGGGLTLFTSALYWALAAPAGWPPLIAWVIAFAISVVLGYLIHSRWSFRGHGGRDNEAATGARFVASSLLGFALNALWVWIATGLLTGPAWWPIVPFVLVTPFLIFLVNRYWVFR